MDFSEKDIFHRAERLLGATAMERIQKAKVIIFGVGGVGSWCAESLVRSGVKHLTIVDPDCVAVTNINRQLMATTQTVGRPKVEVLAERLLEISPDAEITPLQTTYSKETMDSFHLEDYDYIIDCIDSLKDKIQLIVHATGINCCEESAANDASDDAKSAKSIDSNRDDSATNDTSNGTCSDTSTARKYPVFFSSMGAALRIDPQKIKVTEFWKVRNDTLGSLLRKRMRQKKLMPKRKFLCVYSEELPMENQGFTDETCDYKAVINGSLHHITGIFGFTLAGLVISDIKDSVDIQ